MPMGKLSASKRKKSVQSQALEVECEARRASVPTELVRSPDPAASRREWTRTKRAAAETRFAEHARPHLHHPRGLRGDEPRFCSRSQKSAIRFAATVNREPTEHHSANVAARGQKMSTGQPRSTRAARFHVHEPHASRSSPSVSLFLASRADSSDATTDTQQAGMPRERPQRKAAAVVNYAEQAASSESELEQRTPVSRARKGKPTQATAEHQTEKQRGGYDSEPARGRAVDSGPHLSRLSSQLPARRTKLISLKSSTRPFSNQSMASCVIPRSRASTSPSCCPSRSSSR